jgi:hypothetical protein
MQQKAIMAPDKGINKYLPKNLIDDRAWADGDNVHFGVGYVEKVGGWKKFLNHPSAWTANTVYSAGAYVVPTIANNRVYKCTTAGTSGGSQPTWPTTAGGTVTDGTVVWTEVGFNKLSGTLMVMDNYYKYNGDAFLIAITTTTFYVYDPNNRTFNDKTGGTLSGLTTRPVVTENAQNYFVFTNGVDPVKYWDSTWAAIENLPGLWQPNTWQATTAYVVGNYVRPTVDNNLMYRCTTAGTSGSSQPTWPTTGTVTDGTAVWTVAGTYKSQGDVVTVKCQTLLYFQNFLILGNTSEDGNPRPQRVRWSCLGDITAWKNVSGDITRQEAGFGDLTDSVDWVQALRPLGSYVVAYKERSIQLLNYVGGTTIWNKWPAIIGVGVIGPKGMVDLGDEHIFIGNDNIYSFNGRDPAIAGDDIAKEFFRTLDPDKVELIAGFFVEEVPELWFGYVSVNSSNGLPDRAIVYNTDTKAWSFRDMPMLAFGYYNQKEEGVWDNDEKTWDSNSTEWDSSVNLANAPINLAGDSAGNIYVFQGQNKDGAAISSSVTTKLFDFNAPHLVKRLMRIQFMISREGPYNLPVYVGTAANVDEPITWHGPYNMSLDRTYPPWIDVDISARYLCLRLGTTNADEPFKLTGYIMYYHLRGTA